MMKYHHIERELRKTTDDAEMDVTWACHLFLPVSSSLLLEDSSLSSELLEEEAFAFGFHEVVSIFTGLGFCFVKHSTALLGAGELVSSGSEDAGWT
jgi:hypothetical protein